MDPVEAVEQPELVGVPLVAALHTVPVSVTGKLPAQNLLQHATAEICAGRAAEEGGEVRLELSTEFRKTFCSILDISLLQIPFITFRVKVGKNP